jgi:hypothetical protein
MGDPLNRLAVAIALAASLTGCAAGGVDGGQSSITTYGTLDVGISRTTSK